MRSRWMVFLPVALFALFAPQPAQASQIGLLVRGYSITEIPPIKSDIAYPLCGSSIEPFVNATWDYEQNLFGDCGWDSFILHYTGYIQIPEHETIEFWIASDDGGTMKIGTHEFGVWQDQGCSATESGLIDIDAGTATLDGWFYENGGGTCFMLAWNIDGRGWEIVQPEFFTSEPLPTPSTTTTEPSTTTTEMPPSTTTTSSSIPPSTVATTTTEQPQQTTTIPETTSSVQVTSAPSTAQLIPQTTEQPTIPTTIPTTTTTEPTTTTTWEQATTTVAIATTIPALPLVSVPDALETTTTTIATPTTFVLPDALPDERLTEAAFVEALSVLSDATPDEVQAVITEILKADLNSDQAEQLVASTEVLTAITGEQAQQLFEQIEPTQLSESMAAVIADTLNNPDVPTEVKEAFETAINIFGNDGFATYIPIDSTVNVAVRRTIIAGTTILVALPSPVARRT